MNLKLPPIKRIEKWNTHTYELNGKLLTGVTTILKCRQKDFMPFWAAKECVKYLGWFDQKELSEEEIKTSWDVLADTRTRLELLSDHKYYDELTEAKKAFTKKSRKATDKGKEVHEWIEKYIAGTDQSIPEDKEVNNSIHAFLEWEESVKPKWLHSELVLCSEKHAFAGTTDFIAEIDGKVCIGDFKTSGQIGEEYALQLAAYWMAVEEMGGKLDERVIVRIPKNGEKVEYGKVITPLDFDQEAFLALRTVHRWNLLIENKFTEEQKLKIIA